MRYLVILVVMVLSGCSSLNPLSVLTPKPQFEVNAAVGKTVSQEKALAKVETGDKQVADEISNDTSYQSDVVNQITNNLTWWQMLVIVICAGAALPSFKEMYSGIKIIIGDVLDCFIIIPVRSVRDFIMDLKT